MCDCTKKLVERYKKEKCPDADFVGFLNVELLSGRLFSTLEVRMPNKKKPETVRILHSHCPMCGEKYDEPKEGI